MSHNSPSHESGSLTDIRRLTSSQPNGKRYTRPAAVETEIENILGLPRATWAHRARHLQNETLVFLIRYIRQSSKDWKDQASSGLSGSLIQRMVQGNEDLLGRLIPELSTRVSRIAKRWAQGFDEVTTDEIVWQVETRILELLLAETPSRRSEFLEVAFAEAVRRRTLNAVRKHKNSAMGHRGEFVDTAGEDETDGEGVERPIKRAVDNRPGPLDTLLQLEDEALLPELIWRMCDAVKDPRHLEAVILRYVYDWPITDKDVSKPDLQRHFNKTERQIRNWIKAALEAMRRAAEAPAGRNSGKANPEEFAALVSRFGGKQ